MDMCIGLCFGSSVLGDGTISQILHIAPLLYSLDFSCVWFVSNQDCSHWNLSR